MDDYRNPRLPLPARPPVGSITGPAGWGNGDPYFTVPTPRVPGSLPELPGPWGGGGAPLLSNPGDEEPNGDGGSGGGGKGMTMANSDGVPRSQQEKRDEIEETMGDWLFWLSPPLYFGADALETAGTYVSKAVSWISEKSPTTGYWLQGAAEVYAEHCTEFQNVIDSAGSWLIGEKNWQSVRNVFNYDNKYVVAGEFAATIAIAGATGGAKRGASSILGTSLREEIAATAAQESRVMRFPKTFGELFPEITDPKQRIIRKNGNVEIHLNRRMRIRAEQHPSAPGKPNNPRHVGVHYHPEFKLNDRNWSKINKGITLEPPGYQGGATGFLPGEPIPPMFTDTYNKLGPWNKP